MGVIIAFDYNAWVAMFPQFAYIGEAQAQQWFNLATQFHRNDGCGPVREVMTQTNLLFLATAHIAYLFAPKANGQPSSDIVGHINSASEGSVSVGIENNYAPGTAQWWQQSKFGSAYWMASAPFRTMRYLPGPQRPTEPWPLPGGTGWGSAYPGWGWGGWNRF